MENREFSTSLLLPHQDNRGAIVIIAFGQSVRILLRITTNVIHRFEAKG